jgi:hypothetical protein
VASHEERGKRRKRPQIARENRSVRIGADPDTSALGRLPDYEISGDRVLGFFPLTTFLHAARYVGFGMNQVLRSLTTMLVAIAVVCIVGLLARDVKIHVPAGFSSPIVSATSLLLIGVSFLLVQMIQRPRATELLKNAMLAAAFILWGAVQLMAQNDLSRKLGDAVIALYVLDLAWVIFAAVNPAGMIRSRQGKA